ncbi:MAG: TetR/AcrR family transcriptional regulator [Ottowia sp.]|uniref:TetR/AcrR family transcriptional regulator n=1 Tax=Ottowia sp. TaxID=1898956 RepID=UPI0039E39450
MSLPTADRPPRALAKGRQTKAAIIDAALRLATQVGLEGLSIGALAEAMGMSKSGVFAHFGSRDELQISVVREYSARFEEQVFAPAMLAPRGLPRVRALFDHWMRYTSAELDGGGCLFISGAVEFDDRPGPVRDALAQTVGLWTGTLARAVAQAKAEGHLTPLADEAQVVFETHALILALHYEARFLRLPGAALRAVRGFDNVLARHAARG